MMWWRTLGIGALLGALIAGGSAAAQEPATAFAAVVHAGTCESPGAIAAPLTDIPAPAGLQIGPPNASAGSSSYTAVPIALDALLGGDHAIAIHQGPDGPIVACGELGGALDAAGALVIGLRPAAESGVWGIAYLARDTANPAQTGVSTFIAMTPSQPTDPAQPSAPLVDPAEYAQTVRGQVTLIIGSLQRVDALVVNGEGTPADQLAAEATLWQVIYRDAQGLTPPTDLARFHARYLDALALLDSAAEDILGALETDDRELLLDADGKIDQAILILRELDAPDAEGTPAASPAAAIRHTSG